MTEAEQLARAAHAADALANPLVAEALGAWEQEITEAWKQSPLRDAEGREKLRLMLEAAKVFRQHLQTTIETGRILKAQVREPTLWERAQATLKRA